jgi:hypothetical protein
MGQTLPSTVGKLNHQLFHSWHLLVAKQPSALLNAVIVQDPTTALKETYLTAE